MTREDVLKLFPDATDEQVTNLLNQNNSEIAKEKGKSEKLKAENQELKQEADRAKEIQKQLDTLQSQNMTDSERLQKQIEALQQQNADLRENSFRTEARAILTKAGISDECMEALLPGMVAGLDKMEDVQLRANAYVSAMTKFRDDAIKEHDRQTLDNTGTPGGGDTAGGDEAKTEAERYAEQMVQGAAADAKSMDAIIGNYK